MQSNFIGLAVTFAGLVQVLVKEKQRGKGSAVKCLIVQSHAIGLELTCAGLRALRPLVTNAFAAKSSAVLEPSTARSATTDSAGFPEGSTP